MLFWRGKKCHVICQRKQRVRTYFCSWYSGFQEVSLVNTVGFFLSRNGAILPISMPQNQSFVLTTKIIQKREKEENWLQFNPLQTSAGWREIANVQWRMWPLDLCHSSCRLLVQRSLTVGLSGIQNALTCIYTAPTGARFPQHTLHSSFYFHQPS